MLLPLDIALGSTVIGWHDLCIALQSRAGVYYHILINIRLPKALTAILAGSALSVSGMLMQTLFRNPLAGPYMLGVSSGAGLGVAIVVLATSSFGMLAAGTGAIAMSAILGAAVVLLLVMSVASRVRDNVSLLIVGIMISAMASALVNILQSIANPDALKLFITWTLGSLTSVGWSELTAMTIVISIGALVVFFLLKPLNGLLLGEQYARSLGIKISIMRLGIVFATSLLAGAVTAWCGPIAFIGVAVPHLARGLMNTANHRITVPVCALLGAIILLLCDLLASVGNLGFAINLPISTLSSLLAAPVIIYVILRK